MKHFAFILNRFNNFSRERYAFIFWQQIHFVNLKCQNIDVILVSSGAIAEGMKRLGWRERPENIHQLQAAAAVGQMGLVQTYETHLLLSPYNPNRLAPRYETLCLYT
jgi:glutamate 5-kinase